jgi:hypothetical protein
LLCGKSRGSITCVLNSRATLNSRLCAAAVQPLRFTTNVPTPARPNSTNNEADNLVEALPGNCTAHNRAGTADESDEPMGVAAGASGTIATASAAATTPTVRRRQILGAAPSTVIS